MPLMFTQPRILVFFPLLVPLGGILCHLTHFRSQCSGAVTHVHTLSFVLLSGLSAPVPRGRKGKQAKIQNNSSMLDQEMANKMDIDAEQVLADEGYKKHLKRHANK